MRDISAASSARLFFPAKFCVTIIRIGFREEAVRKPS